MLNSIFDPLCFNEFRNLRNELTDIPRHSVLYLGFFRGSSSDGTAIWEWKESPLAHACGHPFSDRVVLRPRQVVNCSYNGEIHARAEG